MAHFRNSVNHEAFQLELDLQVLERMTENPVLFNQVGVTAELVRLIPKGYARSEEVAKYGCIIPYKASHGQLHKYVSYKSSNLAYEVGPSPNHQVIWYYDLNGDGNFALITDLWGWAFSGMTYGSKPLCYNELCLKRSHWITEEEQDWLKRQRCGGPESCKCAPKCLVRGPSHQTVQCNRGRCEGPLGLVDLVCFGGNIACFLDYNDVFQLRISSSRLREMIDSERDLIFSVFLRRMFDGYDGRDSLVVKSENAGPSVFGTRAEFAIEVCSNSWETWKCWMQASDRYYNWSTFRKEEKRRYLEPKCKFDVVQF